MGVVYARTDSTEGADITPGKLYLVIDEDNKFLFTIRDDVGVEIDCLWEGCAHLDGGNWTRLQDPAK